MRGEETKENDLRAGTGRNRRRSAIQHGSLRYDSFFQLSSSKDFWTLSESNLVRYRPFQVRDLILSSVGCGSCIR